MLAEGIQVSQSAMLDLGRVLCSHVQLEYVGCWVLLMCTLTGLHACCVAAAPAPVHAPDYAAAAIQMASIRAPELCLGTPAL